MSIQRILIPVEDPDLTSAVVSHIEPLLDEDGAEGILLRVVPPDPPDLETRGQQLESARTDLEQVCHRLRVKGLRVTADWIEGPDPAAAIIEHAAKVHASLIVQTTAARQDIDRWVRGSVTERVLRNSPTPLLLFNPWNRVSRFKRILVTLDGSESAERVLPLVLELACRYDSEVIAVRAGPPPPLSGDGVRIDALEESLEDCLKPLRHAGIPCRTVVVPAHDVSRAILEVAEEQGAELIAMTTHGRRALETWPFGGTAEKVFRHSPVPLLIKRVAHLTPPAASAPPVQADLGPAPRILVPLDGSDLAAGALNALPHLLAGGPAELTLLRAHSSEEAALAANPPLSQAAARLTAAGLPAELLSVYGDPASEILEEARASDLIVMASHGRSGLARWVRGSVAERVLRRCPVPLLLLNAASLEDPSCSVLRRIVVPHDGSARASAVLPWVELLAQRHDADVVLIRVSEGHERASHGQRETLRNRLELELGPAVERLTDAGVRVTPQIVFGPPAHEILAAAGSADLVALTTHGRSGPSRWWFGSVAERVLRHCRRPLLVVRAP